MSAKPSEFVAGRRVPQAHRPVRACGAQGSAVGREDDGVNPLGMTPQSRREKIRHTDNVVVPQRDRRFAWQEEEVRRTLRQQVGQFFFGECAGKLGVNSDGIS